MSMKEDLVQFQPGVESCVPFKLPEGNSGVDADMEANCVVVVIGGSFVGGMTNAVNVLSELFAGRDVAFYCNASKRRVGINWDDSDLVVDVLEVL